MNSAFEVLPTPVKGFQDKKEYKVIRLKNGLTACLIVDEDRLNEGNGKSVSKDKMAAASLSINVGSFSDPKQIQGLAHCLEHMVFMGSEKYPDESAFSLYVNQIGGYYNAVTECERTTFYFSCLQQHFYPVLDKFAQFFVAPLIKKDSIAKETEVIESEFQMAIPTDSFREMQLVSNCAKEDSPGHYFPWGNNTSLKENISEDDLHEELHNFRKRHYSAHRMSLAIQAPLEIKVLESYVLDCFNEIPCNHLPPDDFARYSDIFDTTEFSQIFYIQPLSKTMQVTLRWALPSLLKKYRAKPYSDVGGLLGDEGKGSLLSYLKKKLWVLTLNAGVDEGNNEDCNSIYSLFLVIIDLTDEGLAHLNEIIEAVFSCIRLLKELGPQEWYHNELKRVKDNYFKYSSGHSAIDHVQVLATSMHLYPPEEYITGSTIISEYDPDSIKTILNCLVPDKMNITVLAETLPEGLNFDQTEKWFGTKYTQREIPSHWLAAWQEAELIPELFLPEPNPFLPEDFSLVENDENHPDYPEKIHCTDYVELWFRKDQKFKLPIAYYYFYLINPLSKRSPSMEVITKLFIQLLQFQLNELVYPVTTAGLSYTIYSDDYGIVIQILGYNEKMHLLLELITDGLLKFNSQLTEEMFQTVKQNLKDYYHNFILESNCLAEDMRMNLLIDNYHSYLDFYKVIPSITSEDVKRFQADFFSKLYVKVLIQGNVTKQTATTVVNNFITTLNYQLLDRTSFTFGYRVRKMPQGESLIRQKTFKEDDSNSTVINYYQCAPFSLMYSMIIDIVMRVMQGPLFDILRTKEQLGYAVSCSSRDTFGILGFYIAVTTQVTKTSTEFVDTRIGAFLNHAIELIRDMPEETFRNMKMDIVKEKECPDLHISAEVDRNWTEITEGDYAFDRLEQEIKMIKQIKIEDVQEWCEKYMSLTNQVDYKKLSIQVVGRINDNMHDKEQNSSEICINSDAKIFLNFSENDEQKEDCLVKNIDEFKDSLYLYPVIKRVYTSNHQELAASTDGTNFSDC